ncbi:MAG: hypothetical protein JO332_15025, partial [Planctomycetaceae bacterium]|nr:hypothetical protein [Planctomycetaceae bacterium]
MRVTFQSGAKMATEIERESTLDAPVILTREPGVIGNAPWWLVSMGIHLVLILGATLVAIEHYSLPEGGVVEVLVHAASPMPLFDKIEAPVGSVTRPGPLVDHPDTGTDNTPDVFIPDAKLSDHYESDDNDDHRQMKGDSKDFLSYTPGEAGGFRGRQIGKNPGVYDAMGVGTGGGGGGKHGGPFGGRERLKRRPLGQTRGTEDAVLAALKWLAHHQGPEG